MPSESDLLRWIINRQQSRAAIQLPAGDDLAIAKWNAADLLLVGVDQVLDGVHFDSAIHSPEAIGQKAMLRNLSDCAAMACLPAFALINVALPRGSGVEFAKALYLGVEKAGDRFNCAIIGGDTGSWSGKLAMSITILGRSAGIEPITRSGAQPGDSIFVTGPLGGSILGRHMTFEPRIALARDIAASGKLHAMLDLSDGLSRDLSRLCELSNVGAKVDVERLPIHPDAKLLAVRDGLKPIDHAMNDGEDYELLFAAHRSFQHLDCIEIGEIVPATDGLSFRLRGTRLQVPTSGWEHSL